MKFIPTLIEKEIREVPVLTPLHLTIYDRLQRYGKIVDMTEKVGEGEILMCLRDLVLIGWIRQK